MSKPGAIAVFGAVILAAGAATRLGRCKASLPLGDETALSRITDAFAAAGVDDIVVVTGFHEDETRRAAEGCRAAVRTVHNDHAADGMFSSVVTGVNALTSDVSAFFVHPVDIPLINCVLISALKNAMSADCWLVPICNGKEGHPVCISSSLRGGVLSWDGTDGLRGFLRSRASLRRALSVDEEGILLDVDTTQDYEMVTSIDGKNPRIPR